MRNQRPKRRQYWTPDQEETVRKLYPNTPTRALAIKLDRTESSVYQAAQRLGLKKSPEYLAGPASGRLDGIRGAASRFAKGHTTWNKGKPGSTGHHPNT